MGVFDTLLLERRQSVRWQTKIGVWVGSLVLALLLSLMVLLWTGVPAGSLFQELIVQVFLTPDGLARTLTATVPMMVVGLAAVLCLRMKFWNIGIEGQMIMGAIAATTITLYAEFGIAQLPLMILASCAGGAAWVVLPALLKLRFGVSEVIVSLLLSNIAFLFLQHLLFGPFGDPSFNFPSSPVFSDTERFGLIGFGNLHSGIFIVLAVVLGLAYLLDRTGFGVASRMTGHNATASRALGFDTVRITLICVVLGGALAGMAGGLVVAGTEYRLSQQVAIQATFNGIVVAALAQNTVLWVPVAALFMAGLDIASASLKVFYGVSEGVVLVVQGLILLTLVTVPFFSTYRIVRVRTSELS